MKKLFILGGCISLILLSCHKNHDPILLSQKKPELSNPGDKKLSFKITDIYSKLFAIKRRIDIINQKTNAVLGKIFITLSCDDPRDNLYRKLNYEPEKFSGQITLESHHLIEFKKRILKGKLVKVETAKDNNIHLNSNYGFGFNPDLDSVSKLNQDQGNILDYNSKFYSMLECANSILVDLNWQDLAKCALSASICFNQYFGNCWGKHRE